MKKWKCLVCGYIHTGDEPPEKCPVCGAPKSQFIDVTETVRVFSGVMRRLSDITRFFTE